MARDDYRNFGNRGQRRGSENIDDRGGQQGGDWQRQQGRQVWYSSQGGGYGQGGSGSSGFGQSGYTQGGGGYAGGSGQQWAGDRSGWQGREGPGMYGQGSFGQGASGQGGYSGGSYGAPGSGGGGYGAGGYGAGGYGAGGAGQGGYGLGGGRESSSPGQSQGRDYSRRDYGMQTARDMGGGGYGPGSGFSGQRGGPSFQQQRGQFAGRGPRGYQRSDDRIREDVNEELTRHPEIDASDIDVIVESCEVTLTGAVEDRRDKRLAEDIAESVPGVNQVHNQLRPRKGIGEKISEMLTGGADRDREGGRDRESGEARSRSGRSTSSATT
jgi:osmotically-inducible protein OsmY